MSPIGILVLVVVFWLIFGGAGYCGGMHTNNPGLYFGGNGLGLIVVVVVLLLLFR